MLPFASTVLRARDVATEQDALTTFGKVRVQPNGTNAIPSQVTAWLDARAESEPQLRAAVDQIIGTSRANVTEESWTPEVDLLGRLTDRIRAVLPDAPLISTGAGHDAGILATAGVPSAMLFVRNPTGISHSPLEHAEASDCLAGIAALAAVVTDLATAP
jgi:N-carbamoyl-L-amino-acid hydrolase